METIPLTTRFAPFSDAPPSTVAEDEAELPIVSFGFQPSRSAYFSASAACFGAANTAKTFAPEMRRRATCDWTSVSPTS